MKTIKTQTMNKTGTNDSDLRRFKKTCVSKSKHKMLGQRPRTMTFTTLYCSEKVIKEVIVLKLR